MQISAPFDYARATSVADALALLRQHGPEARLVAGGHSLLPMMKLRLARPDCLIDINDLDRAGLHPARRGRRSVLRIGALTRHAAILASPVVGRLFPIFHDAEKVIADPVVRNRGTLGGSLCQADPAEDSTTVCDVLGAELVVEGPAGRRTSPDRRVPPRAVRDRGRAGRDPARGPAAGPAAVRQRVREGRAPGRRLGHRGGRRGGLAGPERRHRRARRHRADRGRHRGRRAPGPQDAVRGAAARTSSSTPRPAGSPPRTATRPPTSAGRRTTSGTWPASSPPGRCAGRASAARRRTGGMTDAGVHDRQRRAGQPGGRAAARCSSTSCATTSA